MAALLPDVFALPRWLRPKVKLADAQLTVSRASCLCIATGVFVLALSWAGVGLQCAVPHHLQHLAAFFHAACAAESKPYWADITTDFALEIEKRSSQKAGKMAIPIEAMAVNLIVVGLSLWAIIHYSSLVAVRLNRNLLQHIAEVCSLLKRDTAERCGQLRAIARNAVTHRICSRMHLTIILLNMLCVVLAITAILFLVWTFHLNISSDPFVQSFSNETVLDALREFNEKLGTAVETSLPRRMMCDVPLSENGNINQYTVACFVVAVRAFGISAMVTIILLLMAIISAAFAMLEATFTLTFGTCTIRMMDGTAHSGFCCSAFIDPDLHYEVNAISKVSDLLAKEYLQMLLEERGALNTHRDDQEFVLHTPFRARVVVNPTGGTARRRRRGQFLAESDEGIELQSWQSLNEED